MRRGAPTICSRNTTRTQELSDGVVEAERALDAGLRVFDGLRERVKTADDESAALREQFNGQEVRIREARKVVESVRAEAAQFDVARATAEGDLTHLAATCVETVQATPGRGHRRSRRAREVRCARQPASRR